MWQRESKAAIHVSVPDATKQPHVNGSANMRKVLQSLLQNQEGDNTMTTQLIITRLEDGKTYGDMEYHLVLRDEGVFATVYGLTFDTRNWGLRYDERKQVGSIVSYSPKTFILPPDKYSVAPSGYIEVGKVKEMVEKIKNSSYATKLYCIIGDNEPSISDVQTLTVATIDRIATQYIGTP